MSSTLVKNEVTSDLPESESFKSLEQEIGEMVYVRNVPMSKESIPKEFNNDENKNMDQIIDKTDNEDFLTTWNSNYVKIETCENFNDRSNSTVMEDSYLISDKNHQNENPEYTMIKIEDVSETGSLEQLDVTQKKSDLTSIDSHSVKIETNEDFNANEESEYIFNQIIEESGKVWPEEDFSTSWNFQSVKPEGRDVLTSEEKMLFSIQIERMSQQCDPPTTFDSNDSDIQSDHKCYVCDYSSSNAAVLQNHIQTSHLKLKNNKCDLCDYSSSNKSHLQSHIKSVHLKLRNFKCHLCDYSSSRKSSVHEHIISVHLKLKNFKCDLCDYRSSRKRDIQGHMNWVHLKLKVHLKLEFQEKIHKCHSCDYSSSRKQDIQRHVKSVHLKLKNLKCHLCDYSTSMKQNLQRHIDTMHLKLETHKCNYCDYSTSWKANLQAHMKSVHLKLRNHKCHMCDYSSSTNRILQNHIKSIHLKPHKHKCNLCDYTSSLKSGLRKHIASSH